MKKVRVFEPTVSSRGEFQKGPQDVDNETAEYLVTRNLAEYVDGEAKDERFEPGHGSAERREKAVKRK